MACVTAVTPLAPPQYGVDLVLNGHTHAYERTTPVYNNTINECGPIHSECIEGRAPRARGL
jgi:predicted MPP superfamily phosphohydrolase